MFIPTDVVEPLPQQHQETPEPDSGFVAGSMMSGTERQGPWPDASTVFSMKQPQHDKGAVTLRETLSPDLLLERSLLKMGLGHGTSLHGDWAHSAQIWSPLKTKLTIQAAHPSQAPRTPRWLCALE